jgi:hypothetical protein
MKKNFAVVILSLVLSMNLGSGYTQRIDHRMSKLESSLFDKLEDRLGVERLLEAERKARTRPRICHKV